MRWPCCGAAHPSTDAETQRHHQCRPAPTDSSSSHGGFASFRQASLHWQQSKHELAGACCLLPMHCSLRERLAAEEVARVAAEACAAKSAAAAEAAADALVVKEQQMAAWRDLEQASKATASQQMQLTQVLLQDRGSSMCGVLSGPAVWCAVGVPVSCQLPGQRPSHLCSGVLHKMPVHAAS